MDGVPNFRRVPGYKVYCCGQPSQTGCEVMERCTLFATLPRSVQAALERVCGSSYPRDGKITWLNMRQEPVLYVNGNPMCARPPNKVTIIYYIFYNIVYLALYRSVSMPSWAR